MSKVVNGSAQQLEEGMADYGIFVEREFASLMKLAINAGDGNLHGMVFTGPPGTGKTAMFEALAAHIGWDIVQVSCNAETKKDSLLQFTTFDDSTVSGFRINPAAIIVAVEAVRAGESIMLLLDEWDKTKVTADTFLLHFLQQGIVEDGTYEHTLTEDEKSRLIVCVTMNDHRDPDPAFRRRLRYIFVPPLPTSVIERALKATHAGHPMLETAVGLYATSLKVALEKPVTIQELREWLTAQEDEDDLEDLGDRWFDELVFTFLTKQVDDHRLLAAAVPGGAITPPNATRWDRPRLQPAKWYVRPALVVPPPVVTPQPVPAQQPLSWTTPPAPVQPARPARPVNNRSRFPTGNGFGRTLLDGNRS